MGVLPMKLRSLAVLLVFLAPSLSAQNTLGTNPARLFDQGMNALMGIGVGTSDVDAIDYFRRSAELSYAPAQTVMGYFYETGTKVTADPAQAADWYKKAALQGDRVGQWLLGKMYYTGAVPRDLDAAANWLQKAANQGDPYAQYLLGMVKLERNDYPGAAPLFRRAAMQGLPMAQQQYGELLRDGKGVPADKMQAYIWLSVSYDAKNDLAGADLGALQPALDPSQIDSAKRKARDLAQTATRVVSARGCTGWPGEFAAVPATPPPDIQRFCR